MIMNLSTLEKLENTLDTYLQTKKKAANEILELLKDASKNYGGLEDRLAWFKASVYWNATNVNDYGPLFSEVHRLIEREKNKVPIRKECPMQNSDPFVDAILTAIREGKLKCK